MISYTYEKMTVALNGDITVAVCTLNSDVQYSQIVIEQNFNAGASKGDIDAAIATTAALVWSLEI